MWTQSEGYLGVILLLRRAIGNRVTQTCEVSRISFSRMFWGNDWLFLPFLRIEASRSNAEQNLSRALAMGFPDSSVGRESACNAGDLGSIPGLGRSPGEGKGYALQYSCLENSMDCIVHGVAKSHTWLSDFAVCTANKSISSPHIQK